MHSNEGRLEWTMEESYNGPYQNSYQKLRYQVPNLIRQTTINIAVRLGMDFREGWAFPMLVRFVDGSPMGAENVLAYVQLSKTGRDFAQSLNINLAAYEREPFNFDKVFAHELVHAMVHDAMGGDQSFDIPVWLHEGLAVYGADQGEQMARAYLAQMPDKPDEDFLNGLEGPHGALDYAEDYWAIKYMHNRHGVNSLHNFMRELVRRKGDISGALEYTCYESWAEFQENARKFALAEIREIRRSTRNMTERRPY